MSRKILLINPWIYDFAAYDFWLKPLGLLSIGGLLRRNNHQIHFIDCLDPYHPLMISAGLSGRRSGYGDGKFFRQVANKPAALKVFSRNYCRYGILPEIFRQEIGRHLDADIVLITSLMTYWYVGVQETIKIIREYLPDIPIVLGGKYATLCYNHALEYSGADYVITGAGENKILQLLKELFGECIDYEPNPSDIDYAPYPAFDLVRNLEQVPLRTSRGCPYHCSYCASSIFNDAFIQRNPCNVADEIEYWQKNFGVKNFSFYDDALLVKSKTMIIPLLQELNKRQITCYFHCPNGLHLREINENLARMLYESGFKTIRFGFETSDIHRQKETGGKVRNEELSNAVYALKKAGYKTNEIGIYLLCGLPGQRTAEVKESIAFVFECGAKPILAEYSPIPGTQTWPEAASLSPFDIKSEPLYHNNSLLPCRSSDFSFDAYRELKHLLRNNGRDKGK